MQLLVVPGMGIKCDSRGAYSVARRGVHVADMGVSATVVWVGVRVGFSPGELLDLLLGIVGIDLADDDAFARPAPAGQQSDPATVPPQQTPTSK